MRSWGRLLALVLVAVAMSACGAIETGGGTPSTGRPSPNQSPSAEPSRSPSPSPSPATTPTPVPSPVASPSPAARVILIRLRDQHLWAYEGSTAVVDTVVATGRPELPTVTGTFKILAKYSPYQFISPWPPGNPYWYEPSWTSYAMLFEASGYFIHDAPWRTRWGPGANVADGSHGCVNVPLAPMKLLYGWARVGDRVVVEP